jgi:hypothetical protein
MGLYIVVSNWLDVSWLLLVGEYDCPWVFLKPWGTPKSSKIVSLFSGKANGLGSPYFRTPQLVIAGIFQVNSQVFFPEKTSLLASRLQVGMWF